MSASDDDLMQRLRDVIGVTEAPPAHLLESAKSSLTWRTLDAEIADLVADSAAQPAATLRASDPPQLLTFSSGDTVIVLEVGRERHTRRLTGQVVAPPPTSATVEVRHSDGTVTVDADADGRFRASPVPPGPISVCCRFDEPERAPITTSWVAI